MQEFDAISDADMCKEIIDHNNQQISTIQIEDLDFLENNLNFEEKVSLVFLLLGKNKNDARYGLQRLCIGMKDSTNTIKYLSEWAINARNEPWRLILIEALLIIKANRVLRKLGLNVKELTSRFLPNNPLVNLNIHPILKCLLYVCEQLEPHEANKMIAYINQNNVEENSTCTDKYLEMSMLRWISSGIIDVGDWNCERKIYCNLKRIKSFFKSIEEEHLKDILQKAEIQFNFTSDNVIRKDKTRKVTDVNCIKKEEKNELDFEGDKTIISNVIQMPSSESDRYVIRQGIAGLLLIINQRDFIYNSENKKNLKTRLGTDMDKSALSKTFKAFGYKIKTMDNLTGETILKEIENAVDECSDYDSLVVAILSHGEKGFIFDRNSNPVSIETIQNKIISTKLLGKPKILIIQACQNENGKKTEKKNTIERDGVDDSQNFIAYSDMCTLQSTVPGHASIRDTNDGTWFIQTLCEILEKYGDKEDFMEINRRLYDVISKRRGELNEHMMPICTQNFRKKLIFSRRH